MAVVGEYRDVSPVSRRQAARGGRWGRIAESALLGWVAVGGTPVAFAARHLLRHKTRKQPFGHRLEGIAMAQAGVMPGLIVATRLQE